MGNPNYPYNSYPESKTMATRRGLRICSIVSAIFLIVAATVILTLFLTIFKVKDPVVSVHPVGLENIQFFQPNSTTVPLGMIITIMNPNYGAFKSKNTTGYLKYRDTVVAEVPLERKTIPARGTVNVSTSAGLMSGKLIADEIFLTDVADGSFNLTAKAILPGKVHMLKVFKLKATVNISCDISLNISSMSTDSSCITKIKL